MSSRYKSETNFSASHHPTYSSSRKWTVDTTQNDTPILSTARGLTGDSNLLSTARGLTGDRTTQLSNLHKDETPERLRSPYTSNRSYLSTDYRNAGAQPPRQTLASRPGTAHQVSEAWPEHSDLHTSSSASNLLHEEAEETEEDPRTPIRKLLDLAGDMRNLDVEKCLYDYKAMMEYKDPMVLTREEEYTRSKKAQPSGVRRQAESRYRQERDQYRNERDQLLTEVRDLRAKVATLETSPGDTLDKEREKIKQEYEEKKKELIGQWKKVLDDKVEKEIEKESKFKEDTENLRRQLKEKEEVASKLNGRIDKFKKALEQSHEAVNKLEKEKTDALTRLSKEMGKKLNDKNPNITDLSDSNRPTKIAEKYNELYDNEWTDALEHLAEVYTEENAIAELLTCIQAAYSFCEKAAARQMENIKKSLTNLSSRLRDDSFPMPSVDPQTERMLEEIRKSQKMPIETLLKEFEYSRVFKTVYKKVPEYTTKCLELCWQMHMHSPPMALGQPPAEGDVFDGNLYKEYTRTGLTIHYVVWLPLLLHENGALLQKGVSQPHPNKDKSVRQRSRNSADNIRKSTYQSEQRGRQTTDTNHHLVDEMFNNDSRYAGATDRTRTTQETPVSTSSHERPGNYQYLYGDTGQSTAASYQRNPASSATTTTTTTAKYDTQSRYGNPYTNPTRTSSGFSANYGAQPRSSEVPSSRVNYTEPYTYTYNGEKFVVFQEKIYPYNTWLEMERNFYSPGSSDA